MIELPEAIDIESLLHKAGNTHETRELSEEIRVFRELWSARQDIDGALASLACVNQISALLRNIRQTVTPTGFSLSRVERGLFIDALLSYCRTTVGPQPRRHISIDNFSNSQRISHRKFKVIRDQVFAHHVHKDTRKEGAPWLAEKVVAVIENNTIALRFARVSLVIDDRLCRELRVLLNTVGQTCRRKTDESESRILPLLRKFLAEPSFQKLAREAAFEPSQFFPIRNEVSSIEVLESLIGKPGYARPPGDEYNLPDG